MAASAAFGDLATLRADIRTGFADGKIAALRIAPDRIRIGTIRTRVMSPGENAMMRTHLRSTRGVGSATASAHAVFADGARAAVPHADDPVAQAWLAEAALDAGEFDAADEAADRALKRDPRSVSALLYKAKIAQRRMTDQDAAGWTGVRRWLVAANRADPDDAETLLLYYRSYLAQGIAPTPAAITGLERAAVIAPESAGIRMFLAMHYLREKHVADARRLLAPIAFVKPRAEIRDEHGPLIERLGEHEWSRFGVGRRSKHLACEVEVAERIGPEIEAIERPRRVEHEDLRTEPEVHGEVRARHARGQDRCRRGRGDRTVVDKAVRG